MERSFVGRCIKHDVVIKQHVVIHGGLALYVWLKEKQIKSMSRAISNMNKSKLRKKESKKSNKKRFFFKLNKQTNFSFLHREHWKNHNGKPKI